MRHIRWAFSRCMKEADNARNRTGHRVAGRAALGRDGPGLTCARSSGKANTRRRPSSSSWPSRACACWSSPHRARPADPVRVPSTGTFSADAGCSPQERIPSRLETSPSSGWQHRLCSRGTTRDVRTRAAEVIASEHPDREWIGAPSNRSLRRLAHNLGTGHRFRTRRGHLDGRLRRGLIGVGGRRREPGVSKTARPNGLRRIRAVHVIVTEVLSDAANHRGRLR